MELRRCRSATMLFNTDFIVGIEVVEAFLQNAVILRRNDSICEAGKIRAIS